MTEPLGIGENICHPESTIPLTWLLERNISTTRSVIDSPDSAIWAQAIGTINERYAAGIRTHLVWTSQSAGTGAWPASRSHAEGLYISRWVLFIDQCQHGAVMSATAGNEGDTPGWVDTDGEPITVETMARTAEVFAQACAPYGVQPWATSLLSGPDKSYIKDLSAAVRGICYGVPVHPYYRSIASSPWSGWHFGTVEDLADYCAEVYPDDVACCFDELGCPTQYDQIGEQRQADFIASCVRFAHPKIERLWYFTGPREAIPDAELAEGKDWQVIGHPLAEAAFYNHPGGGSVPDPYDPWQGAIGPGLVALMRQDGTLPAQRSSTWLPLGVHPSDVEEAYGQNGTRYVWLLSTGKGYRFPPAQ